MLAEKREKAKTTQSHLRAAYQVRLEKEQDPVYIFSFLHNTDTQAHTHSLTHTHLCEVSVQKLAKYYRSLSKASTTKIALKHILLKCLAR